MAKTKTEKKSAKELLTKIRKRAKLMMAHDRENRRMGIEDMRFLRVPGEQWDAITKRERGTDRIMLEFNKLNVSAKSIINQMRENRPMGKVRAAEDGDVKTADVFEGVIRNIVANADFDTVTDYAAEYQVGAGMGAWRVTLKWAEDSFNQVIDIDPLLNPFCLYSDPSAKDLLKRDAEDWWYTDRISKESYKARWPDAEQIDLADTEFDDDGDWEDSEQLRIGEYWYKEPYDKQICLLSDGKVIDKLDAEGNPVTLPEGVTILKERTQRCFKIKMCIVSGSAILEGPVDWAGSQHPWVMVYGDYVIIDGKVYWNGITRTGKDAQRAYNYSRTAAVESVALSAQDKPWMTPKQIAGLETHLAESFKKNYPFNLYNPDPVAPGPPVRLGGPAIPAALVQEMQIASDDIKSVTGVYDASLGAQGNETSGKAINARKAQGEIANFNFMDNMGKGVKRTWEILVDLYPKVFDTEHMARVLGADGKESYEAINKVDPTTGEVINDLSRGRFDTVITVGPSYATRRMEAAEAYTAMAGVDEGLMLSSGDLVYKAMDLPYAQEIAERRQALLPPPIQQMLTKGKQLPPEVMAAMAQVEQMSQMVDQKGQLVQAAEQELKDLEASAGKATATAKSAQADLKLQQTQFDSQFAEIEIAKANLELIKKDLMLEQQKLEMAKQELAKDLEIANLKLSGAHKDAEHKLTTQAQQNDAVVTDAEHRLQTLASTIAQQSKDVEGKAKEVESKVKPKRKQVKVKRVNGELIGEITEI